MKDFDEEFKKQQKVMIKMGAIALLINGVLFCGGVAFVCWIVKYFFFSES